MRFNLKGTGFTFEEYERIAKMAESGESAYWRWKNMFLKCVIEKIAYSQYLMPTGLIDIHYIDIIEVDSEWMW